MEYACIRNIIYIKISGLSKNEIPLISDNYTKRKSVNHFLMNFKRDFLQVCST